MTTQKDYFYFYFCDIFVENNYGMRPPTLNIFPSQPMHIEPSSTKVYWEGYKLIWCTYLFYIVIPQFLIFQYVFFSLVSVVLFCYHFFFLQSFSELLLFLSRETYPLYLHKNRNKICNTSYPSHTTLAKLHWIYNYYCYLFYSIKLSWSTKIITITLHNKSNIDIHKIYSINIYNLNLYFFWFSIGVRIEAPTKFGSHTAGLIQWWHSRH